MSAEPIRFFNRAKQSIETEQIYGEKWLRWTYESGLGGYALNALVKRAFLSRYYGWQMSRPSSTRRILPFIIDYGLNVDEFAKSPFVFNSFNHFFYRALKPGARPLAEGERVAVLPADGRHLALPNIDQADGFYAKGQRFDLRAFLGDDALAQEFAGGSLLISRLCPVDYHRFHFPVAGVPNESRLINGWLYSVSPIALRRNLGYLWENKRAVTLVDSPVFGRVAVCEIGATMVGSIVQSYLAERGVAKGDEKGYFQFGGSCVVTIFQRGRITFDADLVQHSAAGLEVYACMGEALGTAP
ncbi:MAG: phosphatidylserine decarboxylase [Candidatus Didemnitutus sp.]|nr:phosphatidylserine decarboxylase [Candidatus Didemnitutus sp.]